MSEFKLSAEKIKTNYETFRERINKLFPKRSELLNKLYDDLGEDRIMFSPASSIEHYHNAFPGGYVDHVLRVMDFCAIQYKSTVDMGIDVSNFTKEELMFSALNHDLGKLGYVGDGKAGYEFNESEWHRKNQGKIYKYNVNIPFGMVQDRSIFLLQSYGIPCSWNEYIAIKIHDGLYDESNKAYYISRVPESKLRTFLPYILHHADLSAARFEYERWLSYSKKFNTERLEDSTFQPTQTNKVQGKSKKTEVGEGLMDSFNDVFKK